LLLDVLLDHLFHAPDKTKEARSLQGVIYSGPLLSGGDYPGVLQDRKVFGHGGGIGADHLGELEYAVWLLGELVHNKNPTGVSKRFEDLCPRLTAHLFGFCHLFLPIFQICQKSREASICVSTCVAEMQGTERIKPRA